VEFRKVAQDKCALVLQIGLYIIDLAAEPQFNAKRVDRR
jgi:hypothetical protein